MAHLLALLSLLVGISASDTDAAQPTWRFVHITDAHVGAPGSLEKLNEIVAEINAMDPAPAFVIDTGDLTEFGAPSEWKAYDEAMKRLKVPFYSMLGNHDTRWSGTGKKGFEALFGPAHYSFDSNGWHFVVLDTSIRFDQHGYLDPEQLEWLRRDLASLPEGTPAAIACHHPPKFPQRSFMEGDDAFFGVIGPYNVRLAFTGHGHSFRKWRREGVQLLMTKAVMDGAYRIVEVGQSDVRTYIKWVGKSAALDTITPLIIPAGDEAASAPGEAAGAAIGGAIWTRNLGSAVQFPMLAIDGGVVVPTLGGKIFCLDLGDGSTKWELDLGSCAWAPQRCGEDLLLSSESGIVARVDAATGSARWEYRCAAPISGGVGADGESACFVDGNGCLLALDAATGKRRWDFAGMGPVEHPPAVSESGVFVANWSNRVFGVSSDGTKLWEHTVASNKYHSAGGGRLAVGDGLAVACCAERKNSEFPSVFALDVSTGRLVWGARTGSPGYCSPTIRDKRVYVTNLSGEVACLSLQTGETVWKKAAKGPIYSQEPCLFGERVYVCSLHGKVTVLSAQTGAIIAEVDLGLRDTYCLSSPVVSGGRLIVAAMDGTVSCLKGHQ